VLWNVTEPADPARLAALAAGGWGVFSPDGRTFATSSTNAPSTTTLWDVTAETRPVRLVTVAGGNGAVFSPDGHLLATRADNGRVILWSLTDLHHPLRIATLSCGSDPEPMAAVVFSPDGRRLVTASNDGTVKLWNVADPARVATLARADDNANGQIGASSTVTVAAFSPDGRTLATVMGNDVVIIWDVSEPARLVRTERPGHPKRPQRSDRVDPPFIAGSSGSAVSRSGKSVRSSPRCATGPIRVSQTRCGR
jgi:WD40 repeat protein